MGWSDLPPDLFFSIATRLSDPGDYDRFRAVCKSWESVSRGFRPVFFPWLAVISDNLDPKQDELSFVSHASNNRIYKRPVPWRSTDRLCPHVSINRDGWMMFVFDDGVTLINNPVTGARLPQQLPSLHTTCLLLKRHHRIHRVVLTDTLVAFAVFLLDRCHLTVATATPGDVTWSLTTLSSSYTNVLVGIRDIVFHDADGKYYAMDYKCKMMAFRIARCCAGRKTVVVGEVSHLAQTETRKEEESWFSRSHLVSDGTNLLQVRRREKTKDFEILKYCSNADAWVPVMNMDCYLGNNSLFFDRYGVRLLPLPQQKEEEEEEEGRPRRNCIYFTDYDGIENNQYVCHVRIYDVGKGTVESCFSTNIQLNGYRLPALMWIMPRTS